MNVFTKEVTEKVMEIDEEKLKMETALDDVLPVSVVRNIRTMSETTNMMAESFDRITIFYGEVVDFDELISDCSAEEVNKRVISFATLVSLASRNLYQLYTV
jgi:hypothetical protein